MESLKPTSDIVFKMFLLRRQELLRHMVEAVLGRSSPLRELTVLNPSIPKECPGDKEIVLDLIREGMARHLERYVVAHRQQVVAVAENWWDKYAVPMDTIEKDRERAARALSKMVGGLGYGL